MKPMLWPDVPAGQRLPDAHYGVGWRGCPYGAWDSWDKGYRRCANSVPAGDPSCHSHNAMRAKPMRDVLIARAKRPVCIEEIQTRAGRHTSALQWFRRLSDREIFELPMVGAKSAPIICEMRDTWRDQEIISFFGFPPETEQPPKPPPGFFDRREGIYSMMGG